MWRILMGDGIQSQIVRVTDGKSIEKANTV